VDALCITKLDVLGGFDPIEVCDAYEGPDGSEQQWPASLEALGRMKPVYRKLEGWSAAERIDETRELESLPQAARRYVDIVGTLAGVPVEMFSVGPGRNQTVMLTNPFRRN
ncbi:MAG: adenylosuccinate synthase, partial [Deltaproteobacteria bacterium]